MSNKRVTPAEHPCTMSNHVSDAPHAVNPVVARLRSVSWHLPTLDSMAPARVLQARRDTPCTLDVLETGTRYRLSEDFLAKIENREHAAIGGVRLGVDTATRDAYAFKEISQSPMAARALAHLHDEQTLGVQARSDVAGRTLLRTASREYLILPLMAGDMASMRQAGGRGKTAAMLLGLRAVLADLRRCHENGVAHRDIKPGNILHRGTPESLRLCDFGLARSVHETSHGTGTPDHMAPEQHWARIQQSPGHDPVPADVWGVGATFLDIWVGNPFCCDNSQARTPMHRAYARWYARTDSWWRWRVGGPATLRFAWAFGKLPECVRPLMLGLLHPDANNRLTVRQAQARVEALLARTQDIAYACGHYRKAAEAMCKNWDVRELT